VRVVNIDSIPAGTKLARDIFADRHDIPLLRRGVAMTETYRDALRQKGIQTAWIEDALGEGIEIEPVVSDETRHRASKAVGRALGEASAALERGVQLTDGAMTDLKECASLIAHEVMKHPDAALHLDDMMGADQYLTQHSVDVTALGLVLARRLFRDFGWLDYDGRRRYDQISGRLAKIGLGLLLHDIGKLSIPKEILLKPGKLDDAEWDIMRRHPVVGVEMLSPDTSFLVRAVVRSHHEKWTGGGYPDNLRGDQIHQFARVASVADVYDAVTSERPYKHAAPPHVGVDIILSGAGKDFDPDVVAAFRKVVAPYPPGYEVLLADGRRGVVVDVDMDDPFRPHVRVRNHDGGIEEIPRAFLNLDGDTLQRAA
jgi:HD-GYP domain-containing protein (c-di-GMP phosphodiesterase class II)